MVMKPVVSFSPDAVPGEVLRAKEGATVRPAADVRDAVLSQIGQLGGEERMRGAEGALQAFESALTNLVRDNPKAYGATDEAASQRRVVAQLLEPVRNSFLSRTVETLRHQAGYVKVWGYWVHRAVFTFVGFGFLAAAVVPFCAVSLMSASAWGWVPGAFGLVAAVAIGAWILSRIRNR
jgi:hypothetical protein